MLQYHLLASEVGEIGFGWRGEQPTKNGAMVQITKVLPPPPPPPPSLPPPPIISHLPLLHPPLTTSTTDHRRLSPTKGPGIGTMGDRTGMFVNDAFVLELEYECDNGIIHITDKVVLCRRRRHMYLREVYSARRSCAMHFLKTGGSWGLTATPPCPPASKVLIPGNFERGEAWDPHISLYQYAILTTPLETPLGPHTRPVPNPTAFARAAA